MNSFIQSFPARQLWTAAGTSMADRDSTAARVQVRATKKKSAHPNGPPKVNLSVQDRRHKTRLLNETQKRKDQLLGLTTDDVAVHLHRYTVAPTAVMDDTREGGAAAGKKAAPQGSEARATVVNFGASTTTANNAPAPPAAGSSLGVADGGAASGGSAANLRWHAQYAQHLQHKKQATEQRSPSTHGAASASPAPRLRDTAGASGEEEDDSDGEPLPLPPATYDEWVAAGCPTGSWAALLQDEVYAPVVAEKALLAAKYDPKGRGLPPTATS